MTAVPTRPDVGFCTFELAPSNPARENVPWLLAAFCVIVPAFPSYVIAPGLPVGLGYPGRFLADLIVTLVIMGFLLPAYQRPRRIIPNPGTVIILIYLFICIFLWGIGISHFDGNAVESTKVRALFYYLSMIGIALYILARIYTARSRAILLGCLASGLFFSSVIGLVQNTAGINLVTPLIPAGFTIAEGGLNPAGQVTERAGAARAIGTFAHAIEFSVAMSAGFFLLVHFARYATQRRTRYVARIAALASLLAVPAAISRSGIIALLAGSLVYVWALKLRHIAGSILAVGVAVPAFAALFPNTATALWSTIIGSDTDTSVLARLGRYDRVAASFHADPMFGKGLGASTEGTLDNQWLDTLVQGGVVGVFGMFLLIAGALLGFAAAVRYANDTRERDQAFAIGAAITAIAVTSSTFDLLGFEQIAFILFLLFGLAWSSFPSAERRANLDRRSALRAG